METFQLNISGNIKSVINHNVISIPKKYRKCFPKIREPFILQTDIGNINTHISGEGSGYPQGHKIQDGLRLWAQTHKDLKPTDKLEIKIIEPFEIYELIIKQEEQKSVENKIARICWNIYRWQKPSGKDGKSRDKNSWEYKNGYGHEEWLLDTEKIINSFHYGFLQPIGNNWTKYENKAFNISLYSINSNTKERWLIGEIKNAIIISPDESEKIYSEYKKRGWIKEMTQQIKSVQANVERFKKSDPDWFFNLKFKIEDLELLDTPLRFSFDDPAVKSNYYSTLLNKEIDPVLETPIDKGFNFGAGHTTKKKSSIAHYGQRESEIDDFHERMKENVFNQLVKIYQKENVGTEQDTGFGSKIDLVIKENTLFIFYEFKTSNSIKNCIREALPQLLEYAYYPNNKRANKLIIVSQNKINKNAQEYLKMLRENFNLPVFYKWYNPETNLLDDKEY